MARAMKMVALLAVFSCAAAQAEIAQAEVPLAPPPAVRDVGSRKQLFMDHRFVEQKDHVRHVVNPPEEHIAVLPGEGFETEAITGYSTIIQEKSNGPLRLYATVLEDFAPVVRDWLSGKRARWPERSRGETPKIRDVTLRLYESDDGLRFRRPRLGLIEHHGSKDHNIVLTGRVEAGKPIPGFTLAECDEIGGNYIARTVTWRGRSEVAQLAGKPVRLHVRMRATKLYAFQFR